MNLQLLDRATNVVSRTRHIGTTVDLAARMRKHIVGVDARVPLLDGRLVRYINFDNAASTPALIEVMETINNFMPWYSSVHRGAGFKSVVSTEAYEEARHTIADFFGARPLEHIVIFGKNTTEALNKLSYRLPLTKDDIVLVSWLEHHSNDLPWRRQAQVKRIKTDELGQLDEQDFDRLLDTYKGQVKLVAVTGGSNVTGSMPDIHAIAKKAHAAGAQILVDCAQLAPHRQLSVRALKNPGHLDYIAVSAHKMYAPFGTGALIGRRDTFESGEPELCGGGTIDVVTTDRVDWTAPPDRDEAGSPNVVGAVAMAASLKFLTGISMEAIAKHEADLTAYTLKQLALVPGLVVYGDPEPLRSTSRLGVIPFNIKGMHHSLVAAILSTEWGIGVRNGCFCAHPYVTRLMNLSKKETLQWGQAVRGGDRSDMPGLVRISFGMYNTTVEVDRLVKALRGIAGRTYKGKYIQDTKTGEYHAVGWHPARPVF